MEQQDNTTEVTITASYDEYQAFVASSVWHDMQAELSLQKSMVEDALASASEMKDIYRLQGQLSACKDFLSMPDDFIRIIEDRFTQMPMQDVPESIVEESDSDIYYEQLLDKYKGE